MIPALHKLKKQLLTPNVVEVSDLTPMTSPANSPISFRRRSRIKSVSNPEPVIRLVAEALVMKSIAMEEFLGDEGLLGFLKDAEGIVEPAYQSMSDIVSVFYLVNFQMV